MKYILLSLLILVIGVGCNNPKDEIGKELQYGLNLVTVDSCEYVLYKQDRGASIVHSGNCHNPKHLNQK